MRLFNYSLSVVLVSFVLCLLCACPDPPPSPSAILQVSSLQLDGKDIALDKLLVTQEGVSLRPSVRISFDKSVELSDVEKYVSLSSLEGDAVGVTIKQEDATTFLLNVSSDLKVMKNYVALVAKGLESRIGGLTYVLPNDLKLNFITRGLNAEASLTVSYGAKALASFGNKFSLVVDSSVDLSKVPLSISVSSGSSLLLDNQALVTEDNVYSGTIDFSEKNVKALTVVSEDKQTRRAYFIEVNQKRDSSKSIISFIFPSSLNSGLKDDVPATIDEMNKQITAFVPADVDVSSLVPIISHTGKELLPADRTAQNFSVPFDYTVRAENSSTLAYTVTVKQAVADNAIIRFEVNGGTSLADTVVVKGGKLPSPRAISRSGYKFAGWYVDASFSSLYDFNAVVNDNLTLYAKWIPIYQVSFNANGGESRSSVSVASGKRINVSLPNLPNKGDSVFVGWYADAALTIVYDSSAPVLSDTTLYARWLGNQMEKIVTLGKVVPTALEGYDQLSQEVFSVYEGGASVEAIYVTKSGSGTKDGSSWSNAAVGDEDGLKSVIDGISDASASKMYVVLVAGGLYRPSASLSMRSNVAIVGGWGVEGDFERPSSAITYIDGGGNKGVFANTNLSKTALMHSVTIQNGKNAGNGGGMYNNNSPVTLYYCTFRLNEARYGGGIYNERSSVCVYATTFLNNKSFFEGGGVYETSSRSMYNYCTFIGNSGELSGGGMYFLNANTSVFNSIFTANSSDERGGALGFNGNGVSSRTNILNCILWDNTAVRRGNEIYILNDSTLVEQLSIYNSVVRGDITGPSDNPQGAGIGRGGTAPIDLQHGSIDSMNPNIAQASSENPGVDLGLYIQRSGDTYYYSSDGSSWYSDASLQTPASPPADAEKLYGRDIRGYTYTGRPDAGAYEFGATAP